MFYSKFQIWTKQNHFINCVEGTLKTKKKCFEIMKIYVQLHNDYIFTDMIQIPKICNGKDGMK